MALRPIHVEQKQPYVDDSCKLLLHFNGVSGNQQFIDSSNNPKVVTAYGNACLSNSHYRFGGTSGYFSGGSDYIAVKPLTMDFGSGDFTISYYEYPNSTSNSQRVLSRQINEGTPNYIYITGLGYLYMKYSGGNVDLTSTSYITNLQWNHVAFIKTGTTITRYINGTSRGTVTANGSFDNGNVQTCIGAYENGQRYTGWLAEFKIFHRAIPIGELYPQLRPYGYPIGGT